MSPLRVELAVTPERVAGDGTVTVAVAITNEGGETVDPGLRTSALLVDGTPSFDWGLAIGNGLGDVRDFALPPGDRLAGERPLAARGLGAGEHELVLEAAGVRSAPVRVVVR